MYLKLYPKKGKNGFHDITTLHLIAVLDNNYKHLKFLPHSDWLLEFVSNQLIEIPDEQYNLLIDNYNKK